MGFNVSFATLVLVGMLTIHVGVASDEHCSERSSLITILSELGVASDPAIVKTKVDNPDGRVYPQNDSRENNLRITSTVFDDAPTLAENLKLFKTGQPLLVRTKQGRVLRGFIANEQPLEMVIYEQMQISQDLPEAQQASLFSDMSSSFERDFHDPLVARRRYRVELDTTQLKVAITRLPEHPLAEKLRPEPYYSWRGLAKYQADPAQADASQASKNKLSKFKIGSNVSIDIDASKPINGVLKAHNPPTFVLNGAGNVRFIQTIDPRFIKRVTSGIRYDLSSFDLRPGDKVYIEQTSMSHAITDLVADEIYGINLRDAHIADKEIRAIHRFDAKMVDGSKALALTEKSLSHSPKIDPPFKASPITETEMQTQDYNRIDKSGYRWHVTHKTGAHHRGARLGIGGTVSNGEASMLHPKIKKYGKIVQASQGEVLELIQDLETMIHSTSTSPFGLDFTIIQKEGAPHETYSLFFQTRSPSGTREFFRRLSKHRVLQR